MATYIILGVCIGSFLGLVYMVVKKMPQLLSFPVSRDHSSKGFAERMKERALAFPVVKWIFSPEFFLQKLLSFLRIMFLRMEHKTSEWLMILRKKSQEKNEKFSRNYWENLKKK